MDISERLATLEARVRELEDAEAIRQLLATYAYNADLNRVDKYLESWTEDGVYDLSEEMKLEGKAQLGGLLSDPNGFHTRELANRSQHLVANLSIKVNGDEAWAEGYSIVTVAGSEGVRIFSAAYNHFDFIRTGSGWRLKLRHRRVVGGKTWGGEVLKSYLQE